MQKHLLWRSLCVGLLMGLVASCGWKKSDDGSRKYLIPWPDASGHYSLQVVELKTLDSAYELKGKAARIYYQGRLTNTGYQGALAAPHLMKSHGVYIPKDTNSATAIAVYAEFEHFYNWEKKVLLSSEVTWPRDVGVDLNMVNLSNMRLHNNARYYDKMDVIGVLPYVGSGLPLELNAGILAHELFHAHYARLIDHRLQIAQVPINGLYGSVLSLSNTGSEVCPIGDKDYFGLVSRGWNEGLADFYGAMYTESGHFMNASGLAAVQGRELDALPQPMAAAATIRERLSENKGVTDFEKCLGYNVSYFNGTQQSRVLFAMAQRGEFPLVGKDDGLDKYQIAARYVLWKLGQYANVLAMSDLKNAQPEDMLIYLTKDLPLSKETCSEIQRAVSLKDFGATFSQCE